MLVSLSSNQLEAFYAVAQTASFTRAAEKLNVTQSALSQRILNLEDELGTTLFIRDRAGLRLTEVAENLLRFCRTKNDLESDFLSGLKLKDQISGIIRIAGFSSVMRSVALPALAPLLKKYSHIQIQMLTREIHELLPLLKSGEVDFIITDSNDSREELETAFLGTEVNVLVESKDYDGPEIYLDHDERDQATTGYLKAAKAKMQIQRRYLDDVYGLIDGAKLGLGRAVLPRHLIKHDKDLRIVNPKQTIDTRVYLHHFKQPYYSKLHQLVQSELVKHSPQMFK